MILLAALGREARVAATYNTREREEPCDTETSFRIKTHLRGPSVSSLPYRPASRCYVSASRKFRLQSRPARPTASSLLTRGATHTVLPRENKRSHTYRRRCRRGGPRRAHRPTTNAPMTVLLRDKRRAVPPGKRRRRAPSRRAVSSCCRIRALLQHSATRRGQAQGDISPNVNCRSGRVHDVVPLCVIRALKVPTPRAIDSGTVNSTRALPATRKTKR